MSSLAHVLSFSGGKDSTAMYLLARELRDHIERRGHTIEVVFADTGHEHQITYDFVNELPHKVADGLPIRWVKADFAKDFERKRAFIAANWPADLQRDTPGRWTLRDSWQPVDETDDGEPVWGPLGDPGNPPALVPSDPFAPAVEGAYQWVPAVKGMTPDQAAERVARALELLHPTGIPFLDLCMLKGRFPSTRARFCSEETKHKPVFEQVHQPILLTGRDVWSWQGVRADESASRALLPRTDLALMLGGAELWNVRPLHRWTVEQVFAIHRRHGVAPNPLYLHGMGRVGCFPCIHCTKDELKQIGMRFPEEIDRVAEWEVLVGEASKRGVSTFFSYDKIPGDHQHDTSVPMPRIRDVMEWSRTGRGGRQFDLLLDETDGATCSSLYGLCE